MWLFKKELARHFGTSYVFEPMHFASTPPMVTAIANNEVQIGELAYSTLPIAIKNAGLDDIRVIADDLQDGVDGYWTARFAVLKDRPIKKVGAPPASRSFHTRLMVWIASGRALEVVPLRDTAG
jgi:sulfonate transport system substrate-binding protein